MFLSFSFILGYWNFAIYYNASILMIILCLNNILGLWGMYILKDIGEKDDVPLYIGFTISMCIMGMLMPFDKFNIYITLCFYGQTYITAMISGIIYTTEQYELAQKECMSSTKHVNNYIECVHV
jgi:hypothetical protein